MRYVATLAGCTLWLMAGGIAVAQAPPEVPAAGTIISNSNQGAFETYFTPSSSWIVGHGAKLKVGAYREGSLPRPTSEATAQYAANVKLAPSLALENYVAGLPFALVEPSDPLAAAKLMLNFEGANAVDDVEIAGIECDRRTLAGEGRQASLDSHYLLDHYRRLAFIGRLYAEPKPTLPSNPRAVRYREAAEPLIEPFDKRGTGLFVIRYLDPGWQTDTWLYLPQIRRARRISSAQRSEAQLGQDIDLDSFGGFAGEVASFEWHLIGEKTVLSPFRADAIPVRWSTAPADFLPDVAWEPRRVWVIEGKPRLSGYAYSKRVIYLDRETYRIVSSDLYGGTGELWKSWTSSFLFDGVPHGQSALASATMIDMRDGKTTSCSIPGGKMGAYYLNAGDTCEALFEPCSGIVECERSCGPREDGGPAYPHRSLPMRP